MLRGTPFHARTSALCQGQNWRRWAGHIVASSYDLTHEREYWAIRSASALIDVSPLYKYRVQGRDALRLIDRIVTRDMTRCAVDQVMYTSWCDDRGMVLDDGTVARLGEGAFLITAADPNLRWLQENSVGMRVSIDDVSSSTAALAVQGPAARSILGAATDGECAGLRFFRQARASIAGVPVRITRTGYTGDLGYEIWMDAGNALPVWDALIASGTPWGLVPAGMLALDIARIEAGLLLISVDYISARHALIESRKSSPFELGLGWTVSLDKEFFVGKNALRTQKEAGPDWRFLGLEVDWDGLEALYAEVGLPAEVPHQAWRTSVPVYAGGQQVGYATSGCWSPVLKKYIALAHLRSEHAELDTPVELEVTVEHRRRRAPAIVVRTPFFDPPRKRSMS